MDFSQHLLRPKNLAGSPPSLIHHISHHLGRYIGPGYHACSVRATTLRTSQPTDLSSPQLPPPNFLQCAYIYVMTSWPGMLLRLTNEFSFRLAWDRVCFSRYTIAFHSDWGRSRSWLGSLAKGAESVAFIWVVLHFPTRAGPRITYGKTDTSFAFVCWVAYLFFTSENGSRPSIGPFHFWLGISLVP